MNCHLEFGRNIQEANIELIDKSLQKIKVKLHCHYDCDSDLDMIILKDTFFQASGRPFIGLTKQRVKHLAFSWIFLQYHIATKV